MYLAKKTTLNMYIYILNIFFMFIQSTNPPPEHSITYNNNILILKKLKIEIQNLTTKPSSNFLKI